MVVMNEIGDDSLVRRLRQGESGAYDDLVRTQAGRMHAVAWRLLGNEEDTKDALQEAFLSAWKGIERFDGRAALSTWLHRITVNAALARLRARPRKREISMDELTPAGDDESSQIDWPQEHPNPIEQADLARLVWTAVDRLGDDQRAVLVLRDIEEMPSKEVAAVLGVSDSLVRQRLHRARRQVAETLKPELCTGREMTCGGRLDLLFDHMDASLTDQVALVVRRHVGSCPACQDIQAAYRRTISAPGRAARQLDLGRMPEGLAQSIINNKAPRRS